MRRQTIAAIGWLALGLSGCGADSPAPAPRRVTPDDEGGATPTEAIADQADVPHPVTTPDDPAEVVDVDKRT